MDKLVKHDSFQLQRLYPNCVEHVWSAWAMPEKKMAWMGGGRALEMDFRPGGAERSRFEDAMGEHVNETRYFEIEENRRIVFAYSMAVNGRVHTVSLVTVLFTDHEGGTRLDYIEQMCVIPPSDGAEGRRHGWDHLLQSLESYLAKETAAIANGEQSRP